MPVTSIAGEPQVVDWSRHLQSLREQVLEHAAAQCRRIDELQAEMEAKARANAELARARRGGRSG
jgi:hypothetical protein